MSRLTGILNKRHWESRDAFEKENWPSRRRHPPKSPLTRTQAFTQRGLTKPRIKRPLLRVRSRVATSPPSGLAGRGADLSAVFLAEGCVAPRIYSMNI